MNILWTNKKRHHQLRSTDIREARKGKKDGSTRSGTNTRTARREKTEKGTRQHEKENIKEKTQQHEEEMMKP